jgi:hypothetical protein
LLQLGEQLGELLFVGLDVPGQVPVLEILGHGRETDGGAGFVDVVGVLHRLHEERTAFAAQLAAVDLGASLVQGDAVFEEGE